MKTTESTRSRDLCLLDAFVTRSQCCSPRAESLPTMPASPTPVPRRRYIVPGAPARSPPPQPRRIRVPGSLAGSRLATPAVTGFEDANMDVDNASPFLERRTETIFAKSDEFTTSLYANLPLEVTQTLQNASVSSRSKS